MTETTIDTLREDHIVARNQEIVACGQLGISPDTGESIYYFERSDGSTLRVPLAHTSIFQIDTCALCDHAVTSFDDIEIIDRFGNAIVHHHCLTDDDTVTIVPFGSYKEA